MEPTGYNRSKFREQDLPAYLKAICRANFSIMVSAWRCRSASIAVWPKLA
jgi:hypothetical protein